jgi:AraC-like DNA-binding protein
MIATFTATLSRTTQPHTHNVHEFIVGKSGQAKVRVGEDSFLISKHSSILIPAGITHHYELASTSSAEVSYICFDTDVLETLSTPTLLAGLRPLLDAGVSATEVSDRISDENLMLLEILSSALQNDSSFSREKTENLLRTLLANHLLSAGSAIKTPHPAKLENLKRLVQQLDRDVTEDISIDLAAEKCHMSRSVFTRSFKSYTSLSFNSYVTRSRLRNAAKLLLRDSLAIDDVATRSGYRNLGHFYKQFQAQFGMTPSEYRRVAIDMQSPSAQARAN